MGPVREVSDFNSARPKYGKLSERKPKEKDAICTLGCTPEKQKRSLRGAEGVFSSP